ncbi:hypothetical protein VM57_08685 [Stenotrophomonas maltophilia]|uniref:Uncharacterized protein n=1 Tax=Stenotrophomonas maltophilia TaxID=40324 RepID=A0A0F5ZNS6_STEMA|nr:hypothetical protein VM57_08685 [Stenotrophomonas maltophilia]
MRGHEVMPVEHVHGGIRLAWVARRGRVDCQSTIARSAEHLLHQVPRALGHAPRPAAGAEAALLAGEGHQPLGPALLAHHAQEAVLEHAAAQVGLELLAHILGQRAVFGLKTRDEVRVVRLH